MDNVFEIRERFFGRNRRIGAIGDQLRLSVRAEAQTWNVDASGREGKLGKARFTQVLGFVVISINR